jgi:hypothetical protein
MTHQGDDSMQAEKISHSEIDAALRQAEMIRSAYIAGACKSLVHRVRQGLGDRAAAGHGLASR